MLNVNSPQLPSGNSADQGSDVSGDPSRVNFEGCRALHFPETCRDESGASGIHVLVTELFDGKRGPQFPSLALRIPAITGGAYDSCGALAGLLNGERTEGTDFDSPLRAPNPDLRNEDLAPTGIDACPKTGQSAAPGKVFFVARLSRIEHAFGQSSHGGWLGKFALSGSIPEATERKQVANPGNTQ